MRNSWKLVLPCLLLLMLGCTDETHGAEGTYTWAHPDSTTMGVPINPDFIHHYTVFYRVSETFEGLELLDPTVYDLYASPPWDTEELDPMYFYQFAVAAVDTFNRTGLMSPWSTPWHPAGEDPGRATEPGAPALIDSRIW